MLFAYLKRIVFVKPFFCAQNREKRMAIMGKAYKEWLVCGPVEPVKVRKNNGHTGKRGTGKPVTL